MERDAFKSLVETTIQAALLYAEGVVGTQLPRKLAFRWLGAQEVITTDLVETITSRVYLDRERIYPCVDIGPCDVLNGDTTLITARIAGYPPAPFEKGHATVRQGHDGPFIHCIFGPLFPNPVGGTRSSFGTAKEVRGDDSLD